MAVRIMLVGSSLQSGGAERVLTIMANYWSAQGAEVYVRTLYRNAGEPDYRLADEVSYRDLKAFGRSGGFFKSVSDNAAGLMRLRREAAAIKPDVVIAFLEWVNAVTILALLGGKIPVIATEHIAVLAHRVDPVVSLLRKISYPFCAKLVLLTRESLAAFPAAVRGKSCVIPNPIELPGQSEMAKEAGDEPAAALAMQKKAGEKFAVSLGRLAPQKGYDILLESFAPLAAEFPEWRLVVWGEGPEREELIRQVQRLGLSDRAFFPGRTRSAAQALAEADLFVLSSRYEGFPMALGEAMAAGCAAVSFDCATGPSELIETGVDGLLVPPLDGAALTAAMRRLMADAELRRRLGERARGSMRRFATEAVMERWKELFVELGIDVRNLRPR